MTTDSTAPRSQPVPRAYTILVADALEPVSESALLQGLSLAARTPASELHVVHVVAAESTAELGAATAIARRDRRRDEVGQELRRRVETAWQQSSELQVIVHLREGNPADAIVQAAIDLDADVIVVGSHRRTGIAKLVLGSVAERVLHASHCPVLVAVPKNYGGTVASPRLDPACPDCLSTRRASANATFWCERHRRPYLQPHIYVPSNASRSSVLPTY